MTAEEGPAREKVDRNEFDWSARELSSHDNHAALAQTALWALRCFPLEGITGTIHATVCIFARVVQLKRDWLTYKACERRRVQNVSLPGLRHKG